jgi:heme-degrading monooxygenase HmoA
MQGLIQRNTSFFFDTSLREESHRKAGRLAITLHPPGQIGLIDHSRKHWYEATMGERKSEWRYVIVWEYRVRPGRETDFERVYGSQGDWVQFFRRGAGFVGTELSRDTANPRRYLTLDFWESAEAYRRFREQHLAEYEAIDHRCEEMTERELQLGTFERI